MTAPLPNTLFSSEANWPFRLHLAQIERCREFLERRGNAPRILRLFGASGSGKSFLARELIVRMSDGGSDEVGIYLDVPASDLEGAALLDRLRAPMSGVRVATRDAPCFVGKKAARSWLSTAQGSSKGASYGYQASRDLTAQIPLAGPFIKALLPQSLPVRGSVADDVAAIRFLMKWSRDHRVLLVLDNVQFLPFALRELLDSELADAGTHLRLVLIERVIGQRRSDWLPSVPGHELMDLDLGRVSVGDVADLVREVMPGLEGLDEVSASVFRRSEGNLKSVWFQLRLLAARRDDQAVLASSYEDVILTLPALDQTVLRCIVFTIGGLKVTSLVSLLRSMDLHTQAEAVTSAIQDLASLGLLVVNGDTADRVRVEHELVAQVVTEITPEDEKLEFRTQVLVALSAVLEDGATGDDEAILYDRLLGIATGIEMRQSPSLLAHVVNFVQTQSELDRHR